MFPAIYRCSWRNDTVQRSAAKNYLKCWVCLPKQRNRITLMLFLKSHVLIWNHMCSFCPKGVLIKTQCTGTDIYIVYVLSNVMSGCVTVLKWYISVQRTFILCHALSFLLFVQLCFALTLRCHLALRQSGTLSIFSLPLSASLALSPLIYLLVFPPSLFFFLPVSPLPGSLPPASQPSLRPNL